MTLRQYCALPTCTFYIIISICAFIKIIMKQTEISIILYWRYAQIGTGGRSTLLYIFCISTYWIDRFSLILYKILLLLHLYTKRCSGWLNYQEPMFITTTKTKRCHSVTRVNETYVYRSCNWMRQMYIVKLVSA